MAQSHEPTFHHRPISTNPNENWDIVVAGREHKLRPQGKWHPNWDVSWKRLSPSVQAWNHQEESGREEWWEWLSRVYLSPADGGIYVQRHRQIHPTQAERGGEWGHNCSLFQYESSVSVCVPCCVDGYACCLCVALLLVGTETVELQQTWLHWLLDSVLFTNTGLWNWPIIYIFIIIYHKSFERLILSFGFGCHCWNLTTSHKLYFLPPVCSPRIKLLVFLCYLTRLLSHKIETSRFLAPFFSGSWNRW